MSRTSVFVGKERHSDVARWLTALCSLYNCTVEVEEVHILQDASQDVTQPLVWQELLRKLACGTLDVLIITPPCNTHTRFRFAYGRGPKPIRTKNWPRGFPGSVMLIVRKQSWQICLQS